MKKCHKNVISPFPRMTAHVRDASIASFLYTFTLLRLCEFLRDTVTHWRMLRWSQKRRSLMLRDVTYIHFDRRIACRIVQYGLLPVAAGRRKVIQPVIMATGCRSNRSKVKGHVGTAIQHSYLGRNQTASWPRRCVPWSGFARSGPHPHAGLLIYLARRFNAQRHHQLAN